MECTERGRDVENRNVAIVRCAVEAIWNRGDLPVADHLFATTYVNHGGLITDLVYGPEAIKASVALLRTAFPGLYVTIERLTAEGDRVDLHWAADSTSGDPFARATRDTRTSALTGTTLSTLADGRITESWTSWHQMSALQRLDVAPLETQA